MTRVTDGQDRGPQPVPPLVCQYHGTLDAITDSEQRALRPIGMTARETAVRTAFLLAELAHPGTHVFQGLRAAHADLPPIPHAVSAGQWLILVESVAWPPGQYAATETGQILCDGVYIGQSLGPLTRAAGYWQEILPCDYRVDAVVVVHPVGEGELALPVSHRANVACIHAANAVRGLRDRLRTGPQGASQEALAVLAAGTQSSGGPRDTA